MTQNGNEFGQYLRDARMRRGFSIKELSTMAGVSNGFLSMVETGDRKPPSPEILQKLSVPLSVPYETLMRRAGYLRGMDGNSLEGGTNSVADTSHLSTVAFYPEWYPGMSLDKQTPDGTLPVVAKELKLGSHFYTLVPEDSLSELGIRKGQRMLVSRSSVVDGDIAFCTVAARCLVRRIFRVNGQIVCQGTGSDVPPIIVDPSAVSIVGKVISFEVTL